MKWLRTMECAVLLGLLVCVSPADAQPVLTNLPSGTVVGRLQSGSGPAQAIPLATLNTNLFALGFCTTSGAVPLYNATSGVWECSTAGNTGDLITLNGGPLTINPTAGTANAGFVITQTGPATSAPTLNYNVINISDPSTVTSGTTGGLLIQFTTNGAAGNGSKYGLNVEGIYNAAASGTGDRIGIVSQFVASAPAPSGGGDLVGFAAGSVALSGATGWPEVEGVECDARIDSGASATTRVGCGAVSTGAVTGSSVDAAFEVGSAVSGGSWKNALFLNNGHGQNPLATTGCVICSNVTGSPSIGKGIDLSPFSITGNAWNSTGWIVDGSGALTGTSVNASSITSANQTPLVLASSNAGGVALPLNATVAGKQGLVIYEDAGTNKWLIGKDTDNAFILTDVALNKTILRAASNNSGIVDFGVPGTFTGQAGFAGVTSGRTIVQALAAASGTLTLPSATDTIAVLAASQALTNKTYNGLTISSTTGTLTIANGKTLTANNSLTLAGTDSTTMTFPSSSTTVAGLSIQQTFTAAQTISIAGTTPLTVQSTGANNSFLAIDNNAGGHQAGFNLEDAGLLKWQFIKQTDNSFLIFDSLNALTAFQILTSGSVQIGENQQLTVSKTGGVSIGATTDPGAGGLYVNGATITLNGLATDNTHTDRTVCQDTTSKSLFFGSGAAGICLGTSGAQFKNILGPMPPVLDRLVNLAMWNYFYKPGYGDDGTHLQRGPTAQDVASVFPDLVRYNDRGDAINYDWGSLVFIQIRAIQELKADNDNLRAELAELRQFMIGAAK